MAPKKPQVLADEWLSVEEAMRQLQKSERSLQRLAVAGHLRFETEAGTRRRRYHAGDVARVKEEGTPAARVEALAPAERAPVQERMQRLLGLLEGMSERLQGQALLEGPAECVASVPLSEKLWLTAEEAQAFGLGAAFVKRLALEGKLVGVKGGPHGSWVFSRESLRLYSQAVPKRR